MLIKAGVDISRLKREIRRALPKIEKVYKSYGYQLIITSTYEGNHGAGSLHYADDAVDTRGVKEFLGNVVNDLREGLGSDYDVVSEADHIHVEYDPKS